MCHNSLNIFEELAINYYKNQYNDEILCLF